MSLSKNNVKTVLIFGVSGVGKSTLISNFVSSHKEWSHLQAGTLLKESLKFDRDELRLVSGGEIRSNQDVLVHSFRQKIESDNLTHVLFDGHSVINNGTSIVKIPLEVIKAFEASAIIFIEASPEEIIIRREKDKTRKRAILSAEDIRDEQAIALIYSGETAESLGIAFYKINSGEAPEFEKIIKLIEHA